MCMAYYTMSDLFTDCDYKIKARIGNDANGGTDADVRIQLYGGYATCEWRLLDTPDNDFQKGK